MVGGGTEEGVVIAGTGEAAAAAETGDHHPDLDAPVRTTAARPETGSESDLSHPGTILSTIFFL